MKVFKKLFAFLIVAGFMFVLASCGSKSGVVANMEYTASTTKIKITATFAENEHLKDNTATVSIKEYSYGDDNSEVFEDQKTLTFSNDIYTKADDVEFSGLTKNTKYLYKLIVTYQDYAEVITTLEATTSNAGDTDEEAIGISTVEEFNAIGSNPTAHYVLKNNLDFTDKTLDNGITSSNMFKGSFDGGNYTIKNVKLTTSATALFTYAKDATIKNLKLDNISADYSTGRSNAGIGSLIGQAEGTIVNNITITNVDFKVKGNSSATINCGAVTGIATTSTFENVTATGVNIEFTQSRYKTNVGLFAGQLGNDNNRSVGKTTYNGEEVTLLAGKCFGSGAIKVTLFTSNDGYTHVGGFSGDISSPSLVYDSYANANITITKNVTVASDSTVSTDSVKSHIAVGGFVGCNNNGSMNIKKCLANASITAYAGNSEHVDAASNDLFTTSTSDDKYYAHIGGFVGVVRPIIANISDCIYKPVEEGIKVYASSTQTIDGNDVQVLFTGNTVAENKDSATKVTNLVEWSDGISLDGFGDVVKGYLNK